MNLYSTGINWSEVVENECYFSKIFIFVSFDSGREIILWESNFYPSKSYLGSLIIVEVRAAMAPSPRLELREILLITSLAVLSNSGEGVGTSSCEDDRATQVDSTGVTVIKMFIIIDTSHLKITLKNISIQS